MPSCVVSCHVHALCQNGYRYDHIYSGMPIGNGTKLSNGSIFNDLELQSDSDTYNGRLIGSRM